METLHPGLYLKETKAEAPVQGVSTSTGAFVGITQKGPVGQSVLVTSWKQFVDVFGGYINDSYLAYAVRGFFENGGSRAFISRAVRFTAGTKQSAKATVQLSILSQPYLTVDATSDGKWGNSLKVAVKNVIDNVAPALPIFDFVVLQNDQVVETYKGVTLSTIEDVVNGQSKLVKLTVLVESAVVASDAQALKGGNDGITGISATDYIGDADLKSGLHAFDNDTINIVAIPGVTDTAVVAGIVAYVEGRKDCYAVIETPLGKTPATALAYKLTDANVSSERVALYYSWIKVADPIGVGKNPTKFVPPSGHIAGIYARTDNTRGVFKAPAGTEAKVLGAIGLEYNVSDAEQDTLNPNGVNAIRSFAGEGIIVWGTRSTDSVTYVPVRRANDYIEQSIISSTRWSVFEPNNEILWGKLTATIEAFLREFWRAGGLQGVQETEAFYVVIDSTTTTKDDINLGKVNAEIGVANEKPSEFVVFNVSLRN